MIFSSLKIQTNTSQLQLGKKKLIKEKKKEKKSLVTNPGF